MRDEYRMDYDSGRGGYGTVLRGELSARQQMLSMLSGGMPGTEGGDQMHPRLAARGAEDDDY